MSDNVELKTLDDIATLSERVDVECKLAAGASGKGALPKDVWETYSAFANTYGGDIFLGIKELPGHRFEVVGVQEVAKVTDEFWTSVNNPQTISCNLLKDDDVSVIEIDGCRIIHIHVPRAPREFKPVHRRNNPMTGTYRRLNSSDVLCDSDTVKRMLSEQLEESRDDRLLEHYNMNDLDLSSLRAYRQIYAVRDPENERNSCDDVEFLRSIGAWKRDRKTGAEGLSVAGLLMFGKMVSIQEECPNYMLDYQEREVTRAERRWIDRVTLDGTWSGNLFDFYHKVIRRLTTDLKVPFVLEGDRRVDQTPVHDALREALVNAIVHADFTGRASVFIVKRPDMFGFRNPGLMRVSVEQAISGYESDCRNRRLHQMFHFIGLGERAGSGIPNIFRWWDLEHWKTPLLYEKYEPYEQTLLELHMESLLPEDIVASLREMLGKRFETLGSTERLILVTAMSEQTVTHSRLKTICAEHAHDLSQLLHGLVKEGLLDSSGYGQGTVYHLPNQQFLTPDDVFEHSLEHGRALVFSSGDYRPSSGDYDESSGDYEGNGLDKLIIVSLDGLDGQNDELKERLIALAAPIKAKGRVSNEMMHEVIYALCVEHYLTLRVLTELLDRRDDYLRKILNVMCEQNLLRRAFPKTPNDPRQAYTSVKS